MNNCEKIERCIACDSTNLDLVLDLGSQPLANAYKKNPKDDELSFPLGINHCKDCHHVQLTHNINPELMFVDYAYMSGVSNTVLDFFNEFPSIVEHFFDDRPKNILDIGCNDGSQLDIFKARGYETYGVDPAVNLCAETSKRHNIHCGFFNATSVNKKFDVVTVQNAFAHNFNQYQLLCDIKANLNDDGLLFLVTSQANMILNGEFDTIYHEHLSFYNINSMNELCKRTGYNLVDVIMHPIHGTSYIFVLSTTRSNEDHVKYLIEDEKSIGLYSPETIEKFKNNALKTVAKVKLFVDECKDKGVPVVGYSAPAKGNTFLNFSKVTPEFIVDDTPTKQGKYSPGMSIPIVNKEYMLDKLSEHDQVCFIIFAWNFYDEIKNKIMKLRPGKDDIFVQYFPEFHVHGNILESAN